MKERIIEIEADSFEEATRQLYQDDLIVSEESVLVLCYGNLETIEGTAGSTEEALLKAMKLVPQNAEVQAQKNEATPFIIVRKVSGNSEEDARDKIELQKAQLLESITLHRRARKGFFGFFKRQNVYKVAIQQQALVSVRFREKARLQASVRNYLAEDLLQIIAEIRQTPVAWKDAIELLNPKNDPEIGTILFQLSASNVFDLPSLLDLIELVCRRNETANWGLALREAHKQAAVERLRFRTELRRLDAKLADVFNFYTLVDREPQFGKEPTGVPMGASTEDWGRHGSDSRHSQTIPHYSTDMKDFDVLKRRAEIHNGYLWKQLLNEQGLNESTATLRQKCRAILKAKESELKGINRSGL